MACPHCESTATTKRTGDTALGYPRFNCRSCRRRFNTRTGTPFNELCQESGLEPQDGSDPALRGRLSDSSRGGALPRQTPKSPASPDS